MLLEIYSEPLFWLFPVAGSAISMVAFLVFSVPMTLVAWADPPMLRGRRIQGARGNPQQWVWPSVRQWLVNNALLTTLVMASWPMLRLSGVHAGPWPPLWSIALQVVVFIYLDDFLFYWLHRALHTQGLYRRIHAVHHRLTTPWAIGAHYMHPVEFILTGTLTIVGPILAGSHIVVLWVLVAFRQWIAAEGHCGYRIPWNPSHLFPGYGGNEFHDFHHSRFTGNYSGFLGYVDRIFGTTSEGYLDAIGREG